MIEEGKQVGSHDEQQMASLVGALKNAGIGRSYAAKSLDEVKPEGPALKAWIIANVERFPEGYGIDFRGVGPRAMDLVNLTGKGFVLMRLTTLVVPLVRLPKMLADKDETATLMATQCLMIRDFETTHECPLRPYELAQVEAFLCDRFADALSVSVWRQGLQPRGWWSQTLEALIEENGAVKEIGR